MRTSPGTRPALVKEIDKLTGLRKDSLKFSYLVLRKDGLTLKDVCGSKIIPCGERAAGFEGQAGILCLRAAEGGWSRGWIRTQLQEMNYTSTATGGLRQL